MGDKTGIAWTDATWNPVTSLDREWASIPGFPAYAVNREGTIVSFYRDPKRVLSPIVSKSGHHYVFLYRGSRVKKFIHRAVLEAWVGPCPPGLEARHLDGCPTNNRLANLQWGSRIEQRDDDRRNGVDRTHGRVLTVDDAMSIRLGGALGSSSRSLAARFGVSHTTIQKIGERYCHG